MLSDESSSDSETGRFKCQSKPKEEQNSKQRDGNFKRRGRPSDNGRFRRDFGRERDEYDKHSRDRHRNPRTSPLNRTRNSRDRSPRRRSPERHRDRDSSAKFRHHRGSSKEKRNFTSKSHKSPDRPRTSKSPELKAKMQKSPESRSRAHKSPEIRTRVRSPEPRSRSHKSPEPKRDMKEETRHQTRKSPPKSRESQDRVSLSPDFRGKRSEVYRPPPSAPSKRKSDSPITVEEQESDKSEEVQVGSYYKMIPTVVKEKQEESSEIDSSDDERLRAKLLNLEKELQKTKKKKHKKKHKRKNKSSKERDEAAPAVEVTSTTDIDVKDGSSNKNSPVPEVSSTQKTASKESSEEGEISSGDDTQDSQEQFDASDLRHKLSRKPGTSIADVCGPMLPPHLEKKRSSIDREGPALPPHLSKSKNIGPCIPANMRVVLAEKDCEIIEYESSEDDGIGPVPAGAESKWSEAHQRLEERALDIKIRRLDGHSLDSHKIKNREEWMLELPEGKTKYLGLEARSFRAKAGPDMSDRSSWTDTPEDKAKKVAGIVKEEDTDEAIRRDARSRLINLRDEEQETAIKKHKKKHKRDESLLELHEKKLKKKKKKEEKDNDGKTERRPFSRDVDLQVNRFDEAQKKSIIKKAQGLNTRFSQGEAKFL